MALVVAFRFTNSFCLKKYFAQLFVSERPSCRDGLDLWTIPVAEFTVPPTFLNSVKYSFNLPSISGDSVDGLPLFLVFSS